MRIMRTNGIIKTSQSFTFGSNRKKAKRATFPLVGDARKHMASGVTSGGGGSGGSGTLWE